MEISLRPERSVTQSGGGERPPGLVHKPTLRGTGHALPLNGRQSPNGGYISIYVLFWPETCSLHTIISVIFIIFCIWKVA